MGKKEIHTSMSQSRVCVTCFVSLKYGLLGEGDVIAIHIFMNF